MHVNDGALLHASDEDILSAAERQGQVVISGDADFGMLLATRHAARPSLILIRSADRLTPDEQSTLLIQLLVQSLLKLPVLA